MVKPKDKAFSAPSLPGVYIFKDKSGIPIYIGKAAKLRERIRSYFSSRDPKTVRMLQEAQDLEFILTETEKDAFFLENELIRKHQPKYNIRLRDDKSYPYLEIRIAEKFPGIYIARRARKRGSVYFGPFVPASWAKRLKDLVSYLFGVRQCQEKMNGKRTRPCLDYYIGRCSAPCVGFISEEQYKEKLDRAIEFLKGRVEEVKDEIEKEMWKASEEMNYERASFFRDLLLTVKEFSRSPTYKFSEAVDIFGYSSREDKWALRVERIRGRTREVRSYTGEGIEVDPVVAIIQFYENTGEVPERIVPAFTLLGWEKVKEYLKEKFSVEVAIESPRGEENELAALVQREAERMVSEIRAEEELAEILHLPSVPFRIEGIDISHFSGKEVVGSVVVFEAGRPKKTDYRHYKLDEKNDDFANLALMVRRRYTKHHLPDLLLVDGGRGQLASVMEALSEIGVELPVISIAKGEERIFSRDRDFLLPEGSPALKLLQKIRDEAHRFAISFHRKVRKRREFSTILEEVRGIGRKRMLALLRKYKSIEEMRNAPMDELSAIIGRKAAEALREKLNENRD